MALLPDCRDGVGVTGVRLRLAAAVAVVVVAGLLAASAFATARSEKTLRAVNTGVLAAVNRFRASHGLARLRESRGLDRSARQHSLEMGRDGYFSHSSANGIVFWRRIQHYFRSSSYSYWSVGENLVWAAPSVSAGAALRMWIGSPEHLRNLLSPQWRSIGVSAVHVVRAPGVFHGRPVTIITADFGVRR